MNGDWTEEKKLITNTRSTNYEELKWLSHKSNTCSM